MKVDFPHPESAATPITTGVCPSFKAMFRLLVETGTPAFLGVNAEGAKAATVVRAVKVRVNFIVDAFAKVVRIVELLGVVVPNLVRVAKNDDTYVGKKGYVGT